jgi:hypothetical protein
MGSSRRAARAAVVAPVVPANHAPKTRRTCHDSPKFHGLIWWEDGWPLKVYSPNLNAALIGPKAVSFLKSLGWEPPNQ